VSVASGRLAQPGTESGGHPPRSCREAARKAMAKVTYCDQCQAERAVPQQIYVGGKLGEPDLCGACQQELVKIVRAWLEDRHTVMRDIGELP